MVYIKMSCGLSNVRVKCVSLTSFYWNCDSSICTRTDFHCDFASSSAHQFQWLNHIHISLTSTCLSSGLSMGRSEIGQYEWSSKSANWHLSIRVCEHRKVVDKDSPIKRSNMHTPLEREKPPIMWGSNNRTFYTDLVRSLFFIHNWLNCISKT